MTLGGLIASTRHVLLDFDGPVCSVFAAVTAPVVASHLTKILTGAAITLPTELCETDDPLEVLRYSLAHALELTLRSRQRSAPKKSPLLPPPPPHPALPRPSRPCHDTGRTVAIVSNNSDDAVRTYLATHNLSGHIDYIFARTPADIAQLKPHPHLAEPAQALDAEPTACVLLGDSITNVQAAHAAGVPAIGYANKANKPTRFTGSGTITVITNMIDLATALAHFHG